jgi:hypothetical protein
MKYKVGDFVAVLDDMIKGKVVDINGDEINIETEDGFLMKFNVSELVNIKEEQSEIAKRVVISNHLSFKTDYKKGQKKTKIRSNKDSIPPMEVDLHINKIVKSTRGMDNFDILSYQIDTAKHKLEFAIEKKLPRVVFIHGVGEGVLKQELNYLFGRYPVIISEASYQKYGMGATEVYIIQKKRY